MFEESDKGRYDINVTIRVSFTYDYPRYDEEQPIYPSVIVDSAIDEMYEVALNHVHECGYEIVEIKGEIANVY